MNGTVRSLIDQFAGLAGQRTSTRRLPSTKVWADPSDFEFTSEAAQDQGLNPTAGESTVEERRDVAR